MVEGRPTTRERAERAVEKQLEKIVQRADFRGEHIAKARETLRIRVASEDFEGIVEALWDSYMPKDLRALTEGNMGEFSRVESHRLDWRPTEAVSLTDELFAFRFHSFCHAHHPEGKYCGEGHIYIGFEGENFPDKIFEHAITAELGHHLLRTVVPDADSGVSELYDFSLSWWAMRELAEYFDHACMKLRLSDFLTEHKDLDAGTLNRIMLIDKTHATGYSLAWKLLLEIENLTGLEAKGIEAHYKLTDVTVKALYDDVDFTSPERYLETIIPRLPEYLKDE